MSRKPAPSLAVLTVGAALVLRAPARAQEPAPRPLSPARFAEACEQIERDLRAEARVLHERCGAAIEVKVDWRSLPSRDLLERYSMSGYCAPPLTVLRELCEEGEARQAVQRKVRRFLCRYGGDDGRGRALRLRGGTLEWAWDAIALHNGDYARQALRRALLERAAARVPRPPSPADPADPGDPGPGREEGRDAGRVLGSL